MTRSMARLTPPTLLQAKTYIGNSDSKYEQEADQVADLVLNHPHPTATPLDYLQGKSAKISSISPDAQAELEAPRSVAQALTHSHGGSSLSPSIQSEMEAVFGTDLGQVRVHQGLHAQQLSQQLNARAFTHGQDIYFDAQEYQPDSPSGKHLLAHELTHVVQQRNSSENKIQGLYRWVRIWSGRIQLGPGISVRWSGNRMRITANMEVSGPYASEQVARDMESTIEDIWNARFTGGYQVSCNANIRFRAEDVDASNSRTQIYVDDLAGPSHVTRHWVVGSRYMNYNINADMDWTPAHEFGHLLGLPDHYSEGIVSRISGKFGGQRENTIETGWEGNLMAQHQGVLERKNLEEWFQLHAYEMRTFVDDIVDEAHQGFNQIEDSLLQGRNPFLPY